MAKTINHETLVLLSQTNGITLIPANTSLTRLNYFDGKFLRADDLKKEQDYLRQLVQYSTKAGGSGVVHGFNLKRLSNDRLQLSAGLATDNEGRVLFMPDQSTVEIAKLIAQTRRQIPTKTTGLNISKFEDCEVDANEPITTPVTGFSLYLLGISHAEALCGQEDVFGKMCEEACVTSTDRPYRVEGVVLRATPLSLHTPLAISSVVSPEQQHLRSRVASAYFKDEASELAHLISENGLAGSVWCSGALPSSGGFLPLAILARSGDSTLFLDQWIARRERIDVPAKRYWQWRMHMRPWDVYLAQILQFQCQLHDIWSKGPIGDGGDPCEPLKQLVAETADAMTHLEAYYRTTSKRLIDRIGDSDTGLANEMNIAGTNTYIKNIFRKLEKARDTFTLFPTNQVLIKRGIVELPSAGYLPVVPGSHLTVNQQIESMLGEGVDLRFCVVRPDYVAHALEEAQHMERISLLKGLDDPSNKEQLDILVPNGEIRNDALQIGKVMVLAREHWVLFHRRRDKQCGIDFAETKFCQDIYVLEPDHAKKVFGIIQETRSVAIIATDEGVKPLLKNVIFAQDDTLTTDSRNRLLAAWSDHGGQLYKACYSVYDNTPIAGVTLEDKTKQQSVNTMIALGGDTENIGSAGVTDLAEISDCKGITLLSATSLVFCQDIYVLDRIHPEEVFEKIQESSSVNVIETLTPLLRVIFTQDDKLTRESRDQLLKTLREISFVVDSAYYSVYDNTPTAGVTLEDKIKLQSYNIMIEVVGGDPTNLGSAGVKDLDNITECKGITLLWHAAG